jgi:hypothetical protein
MTIVNSASPESGRSPRDETAFEVVFQSASTNRRTREARGESAFEVGFYERSASPNARNWTLGM